jgi:hypothetical protein
LIQRFEGEVAWPGMSREKITLDIVEVLMQIGIDQENYRKWDDKDPYNPQNSSTENVQPSQRQ